MAKLVQIFAPWVLGDVLIFSISGWPSLWEIIYRLCFGLIASGLWLPHLSLNRCTWWWRGGWFHMDPWGCDWTVFLFRMNYWRGWVLCRPPSWSLTSRITCPSHLFGGRHNLGWVFHLNLTISRSRILNLTSWYKIHGRNSGLWNHHLCGYRT